MILIISNGHSEPTTDNVIDWLLYYKADFIRLNSEDAVDKTSRLSISIDKDIMTIGGQQIRMDDINVIWYRRWYEYRNVGIRAANAHQRQLLREMFAEAEDLLFYIYYALQDKLWLCNPLVNKTHNKLYALHLAHRIGLKIPATFIANHTDEVINFLTKQGNIITKPIGDPYVYFEPDGTNYKNFTQKLTLDFLKKLSPGIFMSLFQELVKADCEIRTFYLDGDFYSTAIVNSNTIDVKLSVKRDQNVKMIAYDLPEDIKQKVRLLMKQLGLNTGSIDIIRSKKGEHYFLEVNPIGQFTGYGFACNYQLEKKIAQWLTRNDHKKHLHYEKDQVLERVR
jgi:ATP-GRASP peptide maturase of grasp-with-spasm system